jgi:hypothetical protein
MLIILTIYEESYISVLINNCIKSFETNINLYFIKINLVPHSAHNISPTQTPGNIYTCSPEKKDGLYNSYTARKNTVPEQHITIL